MLLALVGEGGVSGEVSDIRPRGAGCFQLYSVPPKPTRRASFRRDFKGPDSARSCWHVAHELCPLLREAVALLCDCALLAMEANDVTVLWCRRRGSRRALASDETRANPPPSRPA